LTISKRTETLTFRPDPPAAQPTRLSLVLEKFLKRAGLGRRLDQARVLEDWPRLVGPQIAKVTEPDSVAADGTLRVRVATASWASELSLMTPTILARINTGRTGRIKSIRWMPGGIPRRNSDTP